MSERENVFESIGHVVEDGIDSAESIHRRIASLPIDVLDEVLQTHRILERIREMQDEVIGSAYDLARGINREVTRVFSGAELPRETEIRRVEPEVREAKAANA